ncbi:MAG: MATE family efflux transporter [Myxococcales bacterium]|nr:MATE family efflux transporter [Myxococcales bacterium]
MPTSGHGSGGSTDKRDLTHGGVRSQLVRLTLPLIGGVSAIMSMGLVDTYFVGRLGPRQLAAMGFIAPVMFTFASVGIGLGAGASSVIARVIGAGDEARVRRLTTDSLVLALLIGAVAAALGLLTLDPLFRALGADAEVLGFIREYMRIWYPALLALLGPMVANNILRANGDSLNPGIIMVVAAVANLILDPVLIFGLAGFPRLGLAGAAWATAGSRVMSLLAALAILHFRERLISFERPSLSELLRSWREVLAMGLPAAGGRMVNPIGIGVVTAALATLGPSVVAGFGVATRVEMFATIPMRALAAALAPLVGQNWGAHHRDRVLAALRESIAFCALWTVVTAVVCGLFAGAISRAFSEGPVVVQTASRYLWIVPASYVGYGVVMVGAATFNALGRPMVGLVYYGLRTIALYAPLAWLLTARYGTWGLAAAAFIANALAGLVAWLYSTRRVERYAYDECVPRPNLSIAE